MLIDKLIPYEKAVRALYAAAFGDDAAADDERINADGMSGRLMLVRNGFRCTEASLLDGNEDWIVDLATAEIRRIIISR
jgi:hypothetical protein